MKRIAFLLTILLNLDLQAQSVNTLKLDTFFNTLSSKNLAMGSVAISQNGKILYQKAMGYAYLKDGQFVPANMQTKYRIGSITKMFTAVMTMQLVEEKKLNLNQTIDKYFPNLPNAKKITVKNLLHHRSGLSNYSEDAGFKESLTSPKTHDQMLAMIAAGKIQFAPDSMASYCNSNYLLLGYIAEQLRGKSYEQVLNDRILSKLGLKETYTGRRVDPAQRESYAYLLQGNKWIQQPDMDVNLHAGAGSIVSNATDLATFSHALFAYKLVSKASLDQMTTMKDGYGMGMFPFSIEKENGFGHDGFIEAFAPMLRYFPKTGIAIAYCANGQVYPRQELMREILNIVFNNAHQVQTFIPIKLKSEQLDAYLGVYESQQPPIVITGTKENSNLMLETRGQKFPLDCYGADLFRNADFGFFFEFRDEGKTLLVKETDQVYWLKRK